MCDLSARRPSRAVSMTRICICWRGGAELCPSCKVFGPRNAAMVAPSRVRGNTDSHMWAPCAVVDPEMAGGHRASLCAIYFPCGILSSQLDLSPPSSGLRVLGDSYFLSGLGCAGNPGGLGEIHNIHGPSKHSHLPPIDVDGMR